MLAWRFIFNRTLDEQTDEQIAGLHVTKRQDCHGLVCDLVSNELLQSAAVDNTEKWGSV